MSTAVPLMVGMALTYKSLTGFLTYACGFSWSHNMVEVEGDAPDELLKELCQHVTAVTPVPLGVNEADVPAEVIAKEKEFAKNQAIEQGKPANIAEKMVEGKIRKFYEDTTLNNQLLVTRAEEKKKVKDALPKGVTIKSFVRYQLGGK